MAPVTKMETAIAFAISKVIYACDIKFSHNKGIISTSSCFVTDHSFSFETHTFGPWRNYFRSSLMALNLILSFKLGQTWDTLIVTVTI